LYNLDTNSTEEEEVSDSFRISARDNEDVEFYLELSDDFREDNYAVLIKAYEKSAEDTQCNQEIVKVSLERERHEVLLENLIITQDFSPEILKVSFLVNNIGLENEDVSVIFNENTLGIKAQTKIYKVNDLKSFSDTFEMILPKDTLNGNYKLNAKLVYGSHEYTTSQTFEIKGMKDAEDSDSFVEPKTNNVLYSKSPNKKSGFSLNSFIDTIMYDNYYLYLSVILLILAAVLIGVIIRVI
jgi:hypothetical protein